MRHRAAAPRGIPPLVLLLLLASAARADQGALRFDPDGLVVPAAPPALVPHGLSGPLLVSVDVMPGDPENTVPAGTEEGLPVAILSSPFFDATTVDPASLTLGGAAAARSAGGRPVVRRLDVDGDGRDDLVAQFDARAVAVDGAGTVTLRGLILSGPEIEGSDVLHFRSPGGLEEVGLGRSGPARRDPGLAVRVSPNPARGPLTIELASPRAGEATAELLDVAGRRLERRRVEAGAAGLRTRFEWSRPLEPGCYVVRVTQGGRTVTRTVAVVR